MRILHVWNPAAVPSILSKYLRANGIISDVIIRKSFDRFGFGKAYSEYAKYYDCSNFNFYLKILNVANKYDIIHIHSLYKLVPLVKIFNRKPVILHYHGTDIRGQGNQIIKKCYSQFSDIILVSTPDLLSDIPEALYLPNPVDLDLFQNTGKIARKNSAIFFLTYPDHEGLLKIVHSKAKEMGLSLKVYNRRFKGEVIPYLDLPLLLSFHEYFIDRIILKDLSKTALEALACGLKVIKDNKIITSLPQDHNPHNVINKLVKIYKSILN